jgi:hypothetical protein
MTATAQANHSFAVSKYWGIVTENIAVVTRFLHNFQNSKQDTVNRIKDTSTLFLCRIMYRMRANNVLPKLGELAMLMALPPVIILPISYFVFKEKISWQAILGTILAIIGVAILFLA